MIIGSLVYIVIYVCGGCGRSSKFWPEIRCDRQQILEVENADDFEIYQL
jgi:hypothetical protein